MRGWIATLAVWGMFGHAEPARAAPSSGQLLIEEGAALATQGRFRDAIAKFKQARLADPARSEPDCMIALAYRRLERWGQAKLYLMRCLTFANPPEWAGQVTAEVDRAIEHLTPVRFAIQPAVPVTITISSFAPDESFAPQTIYVEAGQQLVTITAAGYKSRQQAIALTSTAPYELEIALEPEQATPIPTPVTAPKVAPAAAVDDRVVTGRRVLAVSGGALAVGLVFHVLAASARTNAMQSGAAYDANIGRFTNERTVAIGAYALAAVGTGLGVWLLRRERTPSTTTALTPTLSRDGAGMAWSARW